MKKIVLLIILLGTSSVINAQENKIESIGKVGIGTLNPKANLSIANQSLLNLDWTNEPNWGGNANKWAGYIGFNSYRSNDHAKDYFYRSNNYTKRMAFEGSNNGFRWLGESCRTNFVAF